MGSLSRTVEGWMGDEMYRRLGNEPDTDVTWRLLREVIGSQLFSSEYVTVPYIDSNMYYNQMFVFKKRSSLRSWFGICCPTYKTVGNLDYLVDRDLSTWSPQFDFSPWDVADGLSMYREYRLSVSSNTPGEAKSIELAVMGPYIRSADLPTPGSLKIHMNLLHDLDGVRTLYVISDVVYASYVRLTVRIGTRNKTVTFDTDTPIGFKYRKFKITADGRFTRELRTTMKVGEKAATWLRPTPQPVPWWDSSSRRYCTPGGARKIRSNLTIRSPERRNRRRAWAQEAGALREVRPQANGSVVHAAVLDNQDNPEEEWPRNVLRVHNRRRTMSVAHLAN